MTKDGARKDGRKGGYSKSSIAKTVNVLSSVYKTAVEWEVVDKNPCASVRLQGESTAEKLKFFTPEQVNTFLSYIEQPYTIATAGHTRIDDTGIAYTVGDYELKRMIPEQTRILFNLAIYTGLRKGELLALQWNDIDFENALLTVSKSIARVEHQQICKDPKTKTSRRTIAVPRFLIQRLSAYKDEQSQLRQSLGDRWKGDNWIFIQANGSLMNYSTPYVSLQDAIDRYNNTHSVAEQLPHIPFHGLRHTSATLLIASHQDVRTVSNRMGHAQTSTTMNIYAHALKENDRDAADALENFLIKHA